LKYSDLINFHKENSPDITVVTKEETITLRYGIINVENEEVKGWQEKPTITSEISAGIYMLNPKVLELIKEKEKVDMNELIIRVLENGGKVKRLLYKGRWIDIGKIEDYENAQKEIVGQFENE
jgi:NDP-sugar pyrophosphorylase family protein